MTSNGVGFCSGNMINNTSQDGRQLFLTANHCFENLASKNNLVGFQYQTKSCTGDKDPNLKPLSVHGIKLLSSNKQTDYMIFEITEIIPDNYDVYMAGWEIINDKTIKGDFYCIHHPKGDTKKISTFNGKLSLVSVNELGPNFWKLSQWDTGATETGSSGSGLFNSSGNIIGHLFGGASSCKNISGYDFFGSLAKDWNGSPALRKIMDPSSQKTKVNGNRLNALTSGSRPNISQSFIQEEDIGSLNNCTATVTSRKTVTVTMSCTDVTSTVTVTTSRYFVATSTTTVTVTVKE